MSIASLFTGSRSFAKPAVLAAAAMAGLFALSAPGPAAADVVFGRGSVIIDFGPSYPPPPPRWGGPRHWHHRPPPPPVYDRYGRPLGYVVPARPRERIVVDRWGRPIGVLEQPRYRHRW